MQANGTLRIGPTIILLILASSTIYAQNGKSKIVVLGVTHSLQLANYSQQPAALRTFFEKVNPTALCVERSPEELARNDFYEFTYEQQYCLIPEALKKHVPVYGVDWIPKTDDLLLNGFNDNFEYPAFARNKKNFLGFIYFEDSLTIKQGLHYAESKSSRDELKDWYGSYPTADLQNDFSRRFLYRTFLQAARIKKVAESNNMGITLVVVGSYHKDDIEGILKGYGFEVIPSTQFGDPSEAEIRANFQVADSYAIASFNLLGLQCRYGIVDQKLVTSALNFLVDQHTSETTLFSTLFQSKTQAITKREALARLTKLIDSTAPDISFTWTGVKDKQRCDSYFDPFGNMKVRQRIILETVRLHKMLGDTVNYQKYRKMLLDEFKGFQLALLEYYINIYV